MILVRLAHGHGQQQGAVAELVPQVAGGPRLVVRATATSSRPATASSRSRCDAPGLVPAGDQAVDHPGRPVRAEDEVGPAARRPTRCRPVRRRVSSARVTVVPTATTRPPCRAGVLDQPRGGRGDAERLGQRRLARLQRRDPGVQGHRRDRDAGGHQVGDQPVGERPAGARHLGAARVAGEDRLVVAQRPVAAARRRRRSGGRAGPGTPGTEPGTTSPGPPQPGPAASRVRLGLARPCSRPLGQLDDLARPRRPRPGRRPAAPAAARPPRCRRPGRSRGAPSPAPGAGRRRPPRPASPRC